MSLQRTGDFVAIKTRSLQWENADGSTPATGSVLAATATGGTTWTRDPELDTVTARESIVLMDGEATGTLTYQAGAGLRLNGTLVGSGGGGGGSGSTGPTGSNGSVGPQGVTGPTGEKGDQGTAGLQGVTGPTGEKGDQGTAGLQGVTGPTGEKGDQGTAGLQGVTGPTGASGALTPISGVTGTYTNPTSITVNQFGQVTNVTQAGGPAGLVGDSGTYSYPISITVADGLVTAVGTAGNIVQSVTAGDSSITVTGGGTSAPQIGIGSDVTIKAPTYVPGVFNSCSLTLDSNNDASDPKAGNYYSLYAGNAPVNDTSGGGGLIGGHLQLWSYNNDTSNNWVEQVVDIAPQTTGVKPSVAVKVPLSITGSTNITGNLTVSGTVTTGGAQPLTELSAGTGISISGSGGSRTIGFNPTADVNHRTVTLSDGITVNGGTSTINGNLTVNSLTIGGVDYRPQNVNLTYTAPNGASNTSPTETGLGGAAIFTSGYGFLSIRANPHSGGSDLNMCVIYSDFAGDIKPVIGGTLTLKNNNGVNNMFFHIYYRANNSNYKRIEQIQVNPQSRIFVTILLKNTDSNSEEPNNGTTYTWDYSNPIGGGRI